MKIEFSQLVMTFGLALWVIPGCGGKAENTTGEKQVIAGSELCEHCLTPGSRASFLQASISADQFVANESPLTEEQITESLSQTIIGSDLPLAEVQLFNESRVPEMPRVRNAAEWQAKADQMRQDVLDLSLIHI